MLFERLTCSSDRTSPSNMQFLGNPSILKLTLIFLPLRDLNSHLLVSQLYLAMHLLPSSFSVTYSPFFAFNVSPRYFLASIGLVSSFSKRDAPMPSFNVLFTIGSI